jgi:diguanylate cyclase (GGDEF)-like protein
MIDFDNFKEINDQCGHLMGDRVLRVFADIARKHIRKDDILGRFGGEEFVFIFKDADEQQSLEILKRIHKELEGHFAKKFKIQVTFSAGIIAAGNEDFIPPIYTKLLDKVDRMLYQAKNCGRGRAISSGGETLFTSSDIFPGDR